LSFPVAAILTRREYTGLLSTLFPVAPYESELSEFLGGGSAMICGSKCGIASTAAAQPVVVTGECESSVSQT